MKIIDISQEVLSCKTYPGDPAPLGERIKKMEDGELYNLSRFSMCAHNGTHIDAPYHFIKDGKTVDEIPCENFVGNCYVMRHDGIVSGNDASEIMKKAVAADAGERILIAGDAVVSAEAAKIFAAAGIKLIGNERQTVGPEDEPMEVHLILLEAGVVLLEGIVLENVAEGKYFLSAIPLNLAGFDGAPCRAYLVE
ncbi:MAG: cyclase family protein [Clostridia bacterium]|nr:cyclase family protein [Clostridia bacterium]